MSVFFVPGRTTREKENIVVVLFILPQIILFKIHGMFGFFLIISPRHFIHAMYDKQEIIRGSTKVAF